MSMRRRGPNVAVMDFWVHQMIAGERRERWVQAAASARRERTAAQDAQALRRRVPVWRRRRVLAERLLRSPRPVEPAVATPESCDA
jgi:hypothetical protein